MLNEWFLIELYMLVWGIEMFYFYHMLFEFLVIESGYTDHMLIGLVCEEIEFS
jgi:hypothetical protein